MSRDEVNLKGAIEKYFSEDWSAEEEELRKIRGELASELVPQFFGVPKVPVDPKTIEEHVNLLTNDPNSESGKSTKEYLLRLLEDKIGFNSEKGTIREIENVSKLHYINNMYLGGNGEVDGLQLDYDDENNPPVCFSVKEYEDEESFNYRSFGEKEVEISEPISWRQVRKLETNAERKTVYLPGFSDFLKEYLDKGKFGRLFDEEKRHLGEIDVSFQSTESEVFKILKEEASKLLRNKLNEFIEKQRSNFNYKIEFAEGVIDQGSITFHTYNPRVSTMLDKLLV